MGKKRSKTKKRTTKRNKPSGIFAKLFDFLGVCAQKIGLPLPFLLSFGFITAFVFRNFLALRTYILFQDVGADAVNSYWPTIHYLSDRFSNGELSLWLFEFGLGNSLVNHTSKLFDVFNILAFVLPAEQTPFAMTLAYIVKFFVAALGFFFLAKQFKLHEYAAIAGALIFAYSGFMLGWGQHFMFATHYALLPWIFWAIETGFRKKNWYWFAGLIFYVSILHFYLLYLFSLILPFYLCFRYVAFGNLSLLDFTKRHISILKNYILAVGSAAFILIPSYLYLSASPRIAKEIPLLTYILPHSRVEFFTFLGRFLGNDIWGFAGTYSHIRNYYTLPNIFVSLLVFLGVAMAIAFSKPKIRNLIFATLVGISFSLIFPFVAFLFTAFANKYYRWSYHLVFVLVFIATFGFHKFIHLRENSQEFKRIIQRIVFSFWGFIGLLLVCLPLSGSPHINLVIVSQVIIFSGIYGALAIFHNNFKPKVFFGLVLCVLTLELALAGNWGTNMQRIQTLWAPHKTEDLYFDETQYALDFIEETDPGVYRIEKEYWSVHLNDAAVQDYWGLKAYETLNHASYLEFIKTFDLFTEFDKFGNPNTFIFGVSNSNPARSLLGVKYILAEEKISDENYKEIDEIEGIAIYENINAMPFGFLVTNSLASSEMSPTDFLNKREYEKSVLVDANSKLIEIKSLGNDKFKDAELTVNSSRFIPQITANVNLETNQILVVQIPFDKGWKAKVNGQEAELENVNYGLTGLVLASGENNVELYYFPEGMKFGILISLISLGIFVADYAIFRFVIKNNKK